MSKTILYVLAFLCLHTSLPGRSSAQNLDLSWIPSVSAGAAGYYVYIARAVTGPLVATRIDVGRPAPDGTGVARVRLSGVDKTAPILAVEMTTYDSQRRESVRSNRVQVAGDGETVGQPRWSSDFETQSLGSTPPGFFDYGGDFTIGEFNSGGMSIASPAQWTSGLATTSFLGSASRSWGPYEIEGRMLTVVGGTPAGIGVRVVSGDLHSAFLLGAGPDGDFVIDEVGKPALTCVDAAASTDVPLVRFRWMKFRLRYTNPSGRARLRAKVWNASELEPSLWQVDCGTNAAASQDTGVFALYHQGGGATYWDDLVVRPVTGTLTQISFQ